MATPALVPERPCEEFARRAQCAVVTASLSAHLVAGFGDQIVVVAFAGHNDACVSAATDWRTNFASCLSMVLPPPYWFCFLALPP